MKLIWQYEDQAAAMEETKSSLEGVTDALNNHIKSLKDYKQSLLIGDQSILTTADKYNQVKGTIFDLLDVISAPAITEEQQQAQADAVSKLPQMTSEFLTLSRLLFSSSAQYTNDFNSVMGWIDQATGALEDQLSDAEKQLAALNQSNTYLNTIATSITSIDSTLSSYTETGTTSIATETTGAIVSSEEAVSEADLTLQSKVQGVIDTFGTGIASYVAAIMQATYDITTSINDTLIRANTDEVDAAKAIEEELFRNTEEVILNRNEVTRMIHELQDIGLNVKNVERAVLVGASITADATADSANNMGVTWSNAYQNFQYASRLMYTTGNKYK